MNELRYQLDLMRAMNQKLSAKERMYRLLCDTMDYAYIYYSSFWQCTVSITQNITKISGQFMRLPLFLLI